MVFPVTRSDAQLNMVVIDISFCDAQESSSVNSVIYYIDSFHL